MTVNLGLSTATLTVFTTKFNTELWRIVKITARWSSLLRKATTQFGLSINRYSHSEKASCQERTRLSSPEVWATVTSKAWSNSGKASLIFFPSLKKAKGGFCSHSCQGQLELNIVHNTGCLIWKLSITSRVNNHYLAGLGLSLYFKSKQTLHKMV